MTIVEFLTARLAEDDLVAAGKGRPIAHWRRAVRRPVLALFPRSVLGHMAARHADHQDYREEWLP